MAISVKCPKGHVLKVKDSCAGKCGLCPHCRSRISVPVPVHSAEKRKITDDEILGLLDPPGDTKVEPPDPGTDSIHDCVPDGESRVSLFDSSVVRKQSACPQCGRLSSIAFTHCPRCATRLPSVGAK